MRSDTNWVVQLKNMARGLFGIKVVEGLYYLFSANKGADQHEADLCLCFFRINAKSRLSHDVAHM